MCRRKRGCCPDLERNGAFTFRLVDKEIDPDGRLILTLSEAVLCATAAQQGRDVMGELANIFFPLQQEQFLAKVDSQKVSELFRFGVVIGDFGLKILEEYEAPQAAG